MRKSLFLLFCCIFAICGLRAQAVRPDTTLPEKLQLKKTDSYWDTQPKYFAKPSTSASTDSVRSVVYLGPAKKDSFNLMLPAMKEKTFTLQLKAGSKQRNWMLPE